MNKLILINGDIATGKSHLAEIVKNKFSLILFTKDEFKEQLADLISVTNYEESHKLSIKAMEMLFDNFVNVAKTGENIILEANFHKEHLIALKTIVDAYKYEILNINLIGTPEILYKRYINRLKDPNRHIVHSYNNLSNYPTFEKYTLERQKEELIGEVITVNADTFDYQNDESLFTKIKDFLK